MLGKGFEAGEDYNSQARGIQPRVLEYLFDKLETMSHVDSKAECLVKASYFEIYNEQVMDLVIDSLIS